ncbi:MAG: hypothetical protein ACRDON_05710 [Gaiellaceae bacterium]
MRRNAAVAFAALAGAAVGAVLARQRRLAPPPPAGPDPRAEELRRKLSEARAAQAEEDEFEAAGMGAETIAAEEPARPAAAPPPLPGAGEEAPSAADRGPGEEFEAMRQRIHEEARAAAEEMRRGAEQQQPQRDA